MSKKIGADNTQVHGSKIVYCLISLLFMVQLSSIAFAECGQAVTVSPFSSSISIGQSVTLTSSIEGMSNGTVAYQWYNKSSPILGANQAAYAVIGGATGIFSYSVKVSYSSHHDNDTYRSNMAYVIVNPVATTTTSTTSTTTTPTTIVPTTTISYSCSGTPSLDLVPNPVGISSNVDAVVSGLSNCSGSSVVIADYRGCRWGFTIATFTANATGGSATFVSPWAVGLYGYYACVHGSGSEKAILNVSNSTGTTTTTTSTTSTSSTSTSSTSTSSTSTSTTSVTTTVTIGGALAVAASPSSKVALDVPQSVLVSALANGGTGIYTYSWAVASNESCPNFTAPGNVSSFTYNSLGGTTSGCAFTATVSDGFNTTPASTAKITINTELTVPTVNATPSTIDLGGSANLSASASGGSRNYTYAWYPDGACTGTAVAGTVVSPTSTTTYCVLVSDGIDNATGTATVTVNQPPSGGGGGGGGLIESTGEGGFYGGGGSGGSVNQTSVPTIVRINTTTMDGWAVSNFIVPETVTLIIGNQTFAMMLYIVSDSSQVGVAINGVDHTLSVGSSMIIPGNYTLKLDSITSLPIGMSAKIQLYAMRPPQKTSTTTTVPTTATTVPATTTVPTSTNSSSGTPSASELPALISICIGSLIVVIVGFLAATRRKKEE